MTKYPWLPEPLKYEDYDYEEAKITSVARAIFCNDFKDSNPVCYGKTVKAKLNILPNGLEEGCWHLISEEVEYGGPRVFKVERCERVSWPRAVIEKLANGDVICWKKQHYVSGKKEWQLYIALDDYSFVIVLAVRKDYYLMRTAFPVTRTHTIIKLVNDQRNCDRCP